jgi:hypothetical protein
LNKKEAQPYTLVKKANKKRGIVYTSAMGRTFIVPPLEKGM